MTTRSRSVPMRARPDVVKCGGAKGIRTPDLLDANESKSAHLRVCFLKL